jgi:hypothetical protein
MLNSHEKLTQRLQNLVLKHPRQTVETIASHLWGDDRVSTKSKQLYRQLNPNDKGVRFDLDLLEKLLIFLNEGLTKEDRKKCGGDAIVHYLCERLELVAVPVKSYDLTQEQDCLETVFSLLKILSKFSGRLLECANPSGNMNSAVPFIKEDCYSVQAAIVELQKMLGDATRSN